IVLFLLFLVAVTVFVPADLYGAVTDQNIEMTHYLKLAWLVTSVATVAGSVGSGLEKTDEVGKITYGYRQYIRYEQIKQNEKKKEEEKFGKSEGKWCGTEGQVPCPVYKINPIWDVGPVPA